MYYGDHNNGAAVVASLDGVADDGYAGEGDNVRTDVENLSGGLGSDTLTGNTARNRIEGGDGADTVNGGGGDDELYGDYTYTNFSNTSADTLNGGPGNDTLMGGFGADVHSGGDGIDVAVYVDRSARVVVTINGIAQDGETGEGDNVKLDVEGVVGGAGNDALTGSGDDETLIGGGGDDVLSGLGGDDLLQGDETGYVPGSDVFEGGAGVDTVSYDAHYGVEATIDGVANDGGTGDPGENDNVKTDVENLIGSPGYDTFTGSGAANALFGGAAFGGDTLNGGGGPDYLSGGQGGDALNGDAGEDDLDSHDGSSGDVANCGANVDHVLRDAGDTVNADCEFSVTAAAVRPAERVGSVGRLAQRRQALLRRMVSRRAPAGARLRARRRSG
ncbi:MAG TPA: hypothetical protein VF533_22920 [Solirubrobacteraceae bacterium]|jgi:Ca2+-binding RTX toxin-like protein